MTQRIARKILLLGWDAADWHIMRPLMDQGWMPTLKAFIEAGVHGNLATLNPILSPMLWTSIATGKRPHKHGIHGFVEPDPNGGGMRPVTSTSRRCKAIWNILTQNNMSSNVVGWFASHPAEPINGVAVSNQFHHVRAGFGQPWPVLDGSVHPLDLAGTLADLRIHPGELGKAEIQPFVPLMGKVDQAKDRSLAVIAKLISDCASIHNVGTWLWENRPADLTAVYYDSIDHFCHGFMDCHPPKMPHVDDADFEMYQHVVSNCYKYHDMMLRRWLELAGEDTTVVILSDHGFHSGARRPKGVASNTHPPLWHRPYGMIAMRGPGIRKGEEIFGASLLDITPTLLTLLGLPIGADMDGKVLRQALDTPAKPEMIMSWEKIDAPCGMHSPDKVEDPAAAAEAIQQLVDLGYIEKPDESQTKQAEFALTHCRSNLGQALIDGGEYAKAAEVFEELVREQPEQTMFLVFLVRARFLLGQYDACRELTRPHEKALMNTPMGRLLAGGLALAEGRAKDAIEHLHAGETIESNMPQLHELLGQAYVRLGQWENAERAFRRSLEIDGDSAPAYAGLAAALLGRGQNQDAADAALQAVGLQAGIAMAHFHLGIALARLRQFAASVAALEQCLSLVPDSPQAHQALAEVLERGLSDAQRAAEHRRKADELNQNAALRRTAQRITTPPGGHLTK